MNKFLTATLAAGVAVTLAGAASAATLDFIAFAAGNEQGVADGTTLNFDGLDVTFSAGPGGVGADYAYFDDLSGGKPAGLGVCTTLTSSAQCNPSSDDNISMDGSTGPEWVTLTFGDTLSSFMVTSFYDASHNSLATSNDTLFINGTEYTFAAALGVDFGGTDSVEFLYGGTSASQFYVGGVEASIVPVPAALPLLLAGIGGLGFMARRKRKAT
ncbi:VPLPA-CTERM sorting domain-containing protein [Roseobacter litoralis]|uniref:VPLPA-CTERM sorting domain-containing protein n=1 Tax=Roseobacter litoralis TaxID=42443 RepID=UPI002490096A|nr:VPLPA-CTERM sorting domain-containing protein [Roseobacter litoralis]